MTEHSGQRVLITNDDGIEAPGIRALARAVAAAGHDVVVAAPLTEASGTSAAMTATEEDGRIVLERREIDGLPDTVAYGVAASPSFIALIATRGAFGDPPDIVLSGINRGANAGHAVLHSGTVGAALTAAANGCRAMAVSLDVLTAAIASAASAGAAVAALDLVDEATRRWDTAARIALDLLPVLRDAPGEVVFNVNVPDLPIEDVRGVRRGSLARFGQVQVAIAEVGQGFVRTALEEVGERLEPGSDLALLADNYAVVTPIRGVREAQDVPAVPELSDLTRS